MDKKVIIGLSGGVDSSVAAYVLQQQGYDVEALFMRNWTDTTGLLKADCPWMEDRFDAEAVARKLGIPFHFIDLSQEYHKRVVDYMFAEYAAGRTPNPDVLCNREIKFDVFLKEALKLGADLVATGHYCRKTIINEGTDHEIYQLLAGTDKNKDQSYFLCQLSQEQLSKAIFPIGDMDKPQVREIASKLNLVTAHKKDSQGICFVGKVDLPVFLQQKLQAKEGKVYLVDSNCEIFDRNPDDLYENSRKWPLHPRYGKVVGKHQGAQFYTIGQRKGLNIGGFPEPLFIIGTDIKYNQIYVGMGENHHGLYRKVLRVERKDEHFIRPDLQFQPGDTQRFKARIRYRQPLQDCTIKQQENELFVIFDSPQKAITPGQFLALYDREELIASGVIAE